MVDYNFGRTSTGTGRVVVLLLAADERSPFVEGSKYTAVDKS